MKNIVIVYESIPEQTDLYVLEVEDKDFTWMKKCHGHWINTDMPKDAEAACNRLSEYLMDKVKYTSKKYLPLKGYDALIVTGFIL